jgi:hypothetical protein
VTHSAQHIDENYKNLSSETATLTRSFVALMVLRGAMILSLVIDYVRTTFIALAAMQRMDDSTATETILRLC